MGEPELSNNIVHKDSMQTHTTVYTTQTLLSEGVDWYNPMHTFSSLVFIDVYFLTFYWFH